MSYTIQFQAVDGVWRDAMWATPPGDTRTEAERLAAKRSSNGLVYRVRKGKQTVSKFQYGNQLTKDDA